MRALVCGLLAAALLGCGSSSSATTEDPIETGGSSGSSGQSGAAGATGGKGGAPGAGQGGTGGAGQGGGGGGSEPAGSAGAAGSAAGASGSSGQAGEGGGAGQSGGAGAGGDCAPPPACDAPPPDPGKKRPWNHSIVSAATSALGDPNHRGRDLFLNPGEEQWIIGKFAYGLNDKDIKEEEVDIYLLRDCGTTWEKLGTSITTADDKHPTVEGVEDTGGRIFFRIPSDKRVGPGLHRVHLVVAGDLTSTDMFLNVVDPGTPMILSDVDGTLTTSENVEFTALLKGELPEAHVDAGKALSLLAARGYQVMYMSARPEWLTERTRGFVKERGLPRGIIHTTTTLTGATGTAASTYKSNELSMLAARGLVPAWAFGNKDSDALAYDNAKIEPASQRVFYQFTDTLYGGRRIEEYTELLPEFGLLPKVCAAPL